MNRKISPTTVSGLVVIATGLLVIVGWFLDIDVFKRVYPGLPAMEVTSAICFCASGLILISAPHALKGSRGWYQLATVFGMLTIFSLMPITVILIGTGSYSGIEGFFSYPDSIQLPNWGTLRSNALMGFIAVIALYGKSKLARYIKWLGALMVVLGSIGYFSILLAIPELYERFESIESIMALHSSLTIIFTGLCVISFLKVDETHH